MLGHCWGAKLTSLRATCGGSVYGGVALWVHRLRWVDARAVLRFGRGRFSTIILL